jgi:hypothetical protein
MPQKSTVDLMIDDLKLQIMNLSGDRATYRAIATNKIERKIAPVCIFEEIKDIAVRSTNILNLDWASIDFLKTDQGPILIEVNPSLNWWPGYDKLATLFVPSMEEEVINSIIKRTDSLINLEVTLDKNY